MRNLAPLIALALLSQPAASAEPLGRLFFTPEQRASLDAARAKKAPPPTSEKDKPQAAPTPEVVTYGGLVRRSDGKTTVWLNNRALTEKDRGDGAIAGKVSPDGRVTVQSPQTGRRVELKVGQSAELLSGSVEEGYQRRGAPKPEEARAEEKPAPKPAADAGAASATASARRDERDREDRLERMDNALKALEVKTATKPDLSAPASTAPASTAPVQVYPPPR